MTDELNITLCQYHGCNYNATHVIDLKGYAVMLCEKHEDSLHDSTGYCGVNCMLGYGCSQEC